MTDKQLIAQLNNLKKVSPDSAWLSGNRELLLSQISNSGGVKLSLWQSFAINLSSALKAAAQPAYALAALVVILIVGSLTSAKFFSDKKPDDSLYIARIISEQVQLTTTFNSDARNRLAGQFATAHAQDIAAILADPQFNTSTNQAEVASLSDNFNTAVATAKDKIAQLAPASAARAVGSDQANASSDLLTIAGSDKDKSGIQLLDNTKAQPDLNGVIKTDQGQAAGNQPIMHDVATGLTTLLASSTGTSLNLSASSTLPGLPAASSSALISQPTSSPAAAIKILDEAKQLFDAKDYDQASAKLQEINQIIK